MQQAGVNLRAHPALAQAADGEQAKVSSRRGRYSLFVVARVSSRRGCSFVVASEAHAVSATSFRCQRQREQYSCFLYVDYIAGVANKFFPPPHISLSLSPVSLLFLAPSPLRTPSLSHVMVMDVSLGEWVCRCVL